MEYKYLNKLKIKIREEGGIPYILGKDIKNKLSKEQYKKFKEFFGIQTCLLTKNHKIGMYLHDVDSCLERVFTGVLSGSQLFWD